MLVEYFVQRYARKAGKSIRTIEKRTLERLQAVRVARQYSRVAESDRTIGDPEFRGHLCGR